MAGMDDIVTWLHANDASKHHVASLKKDYFSHTHVICDLERKFSWICLITVSFFICHPLQIIIVHYKLRIATRLVLDEDDNGEFSLERDRDGGSVMVD